MEKRFPLTWAFEGTRSRTGKLMPPRYGLLKYVLEAAQATGTQDINVVPVAVSYDLMRDVEDYASEQAGRPKQPESLKWFVGYLSSLRRPMGRMYLNFGEPVVLEQPPDPEDSIALSKILFEVAVRAHRVTPITLPASYNFAYCMPYEVITTLTTICKNDCPYSVDRRRLSH